MSTSQFVDATITGSDARATMPVRKSRKTTDRAVMEWLLEPESPTVRLLALTELLGKRANDRQVRAARADIMQRGVVPAILAKQAPNGGWGKPDAFYMARYRGTVWQLIVLAEHLADGKDARVRRACETLLASSQDVESGGFSYQRAKRGPGGEPSGVIPCLAGNVVFSLLRLGMLGDPRVRHGVEWLTRYLRFDDGDTAPPKDFPYRHWKRCYGRHSCFMGVVKGLKALAEIPAARRSSAVQRTLAEGSEFLLKHHVYKRSHDLTLVAKHEWTRFGFPRMYQTDVLEITLLLLGLGCRDRRLAEALELVRSQRQPDGTWLLHDSLQGRLVINIEKKDEPSKWLTLNALRVLEASGR